MTYDKPCFFSSFSFWFAFRCVDASSEIGRQQPTAPSSGGAQIKTNSGARIRGEPNGGSRSPNRAHRKGRAVVGSGPTSPLSGGAMCYDDRGGNAA